MLEDKAIAESRTRPVLSLVGVARDRSNMAVAPFMRLVHSVSLPDVCLEFHDELSKIETDWKAFEKTAHCTVFQTFAWLEKWQRHIGAPAGIRPAIVMGRNAQGALLFIFPLAVETRGTIRRLMWLGSDLCDYNGPLLSDQFLRHAGVGGFALLWRDVIKLVRKTIHARFDVIDLHRMPEMMGADVNPLLALKVLAHPSAAHVASLAENWDAFYTAKRSSATRKTERKKLRQLGEHGEVGLVAAQGSAERAIILNTLMEQKSQWFAKQGVKNIFSGPGRREFFLDVATDPAMREMVRVSKLSVGQVDAATSVELRFGNTSYLVLSSYHDGELARLGPGRIHLHKLMEKAIEQGIRSFDFTVGDELYKRDWSDKEVKLYDHLAAVTLRGWLAVAAITTFRRTKRLIKQTPALWRTYSALRALKGRLSARQSLPAETE